jgi:hypothetical protein
MILEAFLLAWSISSVVTTETTGKSVTDHAVSAYQDKDCKVLRGFKGEDVCRPKATVTVSSVPKDSIPPVNPESPPPKRVVIVQTSVDRAEDVFAQRRTMK